MIEQIKEFLIQYLNENLLTSDTFILYSKNKNYSELIKFKDNNFEIIKTCKNPSKSNISVCDNKFLTQNEVNHAVYLTGYDWNNHKENSYVMKINGIEFIGGDEEFSVECINLIVNFDTYQQLHL
jgi:hypothetical protein